MFSSIGQPKEVSTPGSGDLVNSWNYKLVANGPILKSPKLWWLFPGNCMVLYWQKRGRSNMRLGHQRANVWNVQRRRQGDAVLCRWSRTRSWSNTTTPMWSVTRSTLAVYRAMLQHQLYLAQRTCLVVMTTLWRHWMTSQSRLSLWCVKMILHGRRRSTFAAVCVQQWCFCAFTIQNYAL